MHALPDDIATVIGMFAPLFTQPTFAHAERLLIGAILAPGRRTVAAVLRILGLADEPQFQQYHRVLNRAVWSSRRAAGLLVQALVAVFGAEGQPVRQAAWYPKAQPTFADALACVRRHLWRSQGFAMSLSRPDRTKLIPTLHDRLVETVCYAA